MGDSAYIPLPILIALLALFAPLCSFFISVIGGKSTKSGLPATFMISISLVAAIFLFVNVWDKEVVHQQISWFTIGEQEFKVGLVLNNLSVLMLLLVCTIALPVHIYSICYMRGDRGIHRYWMYLSLFCFAMLGLVLADNLLLMYIGWELVGFASYLLIGFWFTKQAAIKANKKAFLINRIGDLGFLIGIAIVYSQFRTLDLLTLFGDNGVVKQAINDGVTWGFSGREMPAVWLSIAGIAFFLGAMAKSAQFPFHIWLPDAMEGPTAVSSLIHAATMVAAGVFMLVRISPLFDDAVLMLISIVGAFTAFMSATIALTQRDIKKILAFSTISQLGFMMVAIGIGQFGTAIFHLVTHAFFKCLLFLSAGAIIHEMYHLKRISGLDFDTQDINNMGGLRKFMPKTFCLTLVAALALAGLPLSAGYLSKDAILIYSFEWAELHQGIWIILPLSLLLTSALTAFYIARFVFKIFFGEFQLKIIFNKNLHLHEAPKWMLYPMFFLGICSLFPLFSYNPFLFEDVWVLKGFDITESLQRVNIYHTVVPAAVNGLSIVVIFVAWRWYARLKYPIRLSSGILYRFSVSQWYADLAYSRLVVRPILFISKVLYGVDRQLVDGTVDQLGKITLTLSSIAAWLDSYLIDGLVNGAGKWSFAIGNFLRGSRNGKVQHYMLSMFLIFLIVLLFGLKFF